MSEKTLKLIPVEANQSCVALATEILERAKSGDIIGLAVCTVDRSNKSSQGWSGGDYHKFTMLGSMEILKRDFLGKEIEKR